MEKVYNFLIVFFDETIENGIKVMENNGYHIFNKYNGRNSKQIVHCRTTIRRMRKLAYIFREEIGYCGYAIYKMFPDM